MSQVAKIRRVKHHGAHVYLGLRNGTDSYTGNPVQVIKWLCDGYRTRFNQHRATEEVFLWGKHPDEADRFLIRGSDGKPAKRPLGTGPGKIKDSQARADFSYMAAMPVQVIQHAGRVENTEWWAAKKRRKTLKTKGKDPGSLPGFRSKKAGDMRFGAWYNGGRNAVFHQTGKKSGVLAITGQNPSGKTRPESKGLRWKLGITLHVSQPIRPYTSVQVDWARMQVTFINDAPIIERPGTGAVVGIDRGVAHTLASSDGRFYDSPGTKDEQKRRAFWQKRMNKARQIAEAEGRDYRTSNRYRQVRKNASAQSAKIARIRKDFAHKTSTILAREYDVIVAEDLQVAAMTRSARGTVENPGKNVAQKRALNRSILEQGWSQLLGMIAYKTRSLLPGDDTSRLVVVDPKYTSQRCNNCGVIDAENRESQAVFQCRTCGHTAHADTNAAQNILDRHIRGWTGPTRSKSKTTKAAVMSPGGVCVES